MSFGSLFLFAVYIILLFCCEDLLSLFILYQFDLCIFAALIIRAYRSDKNFCVCVFNRYWFLFAENRSEIVAEVNYATVTEKTKKKNKKKKAEDSTPDVGMKKLLKRIMFIDYLNNLIMGSLAFPSK